MILDSMLKSLGHCFDSSDCELLRSVQACKPFMSRSVTVPQNTGFTSQLLQLDQSLASVHHAVAFPTQEIQVPAIN